MAPPWTDDWWRADAAAWAVEHATAAGYIVAGAVRQPHIRPWSTVLQVPTTTGPLWFKAGGPGQRHEPALLVALAAGVPDAVLHPLAVDPDAGWMLLPDGGPRLREAVDDAEVVAHWSRLLPEHAELQRRMATAVDALAAVGTPELRPLQIPGVLRRMLADPAVTQPQHPDGMSPTMHSRLLSLAPDVTDWCATLESSGVPVSLQHDDLHDGNVFADAGHGYRVYDWGDAYIGHPFSVLRVVLGSVGARLRLADGDPALVRLRDAYLEPWTSEQARWELEQLAALAVRVAAVGRALGWRRAMQEATEDDLAEWGSAPAQWLAALLESAPLG